MVDELKAKIEALTERLDIEVKNLLRIIDSLKGHDYDFVQGELKELRRLAEKNEKTIIQLASRIDATIEKESVNVEVDHTNQEIRDMYEKSGVTLKEIGNILGCGIPAASKLINGMVDDKSKRRKVYIFMKEKLLQEVK